MRETAWLLPIIVLCGMAGNFLTFDPASDEREVAWFAALAFFAPALGEEILFRAMLVPRRDEAAAASPAIVLSAAAFVAWHPFQTLLFGVESVPVFLNGWFLLAIAALGLALARIYRATGSLWPCILVHWLIVVGWKAFLGGPPAPFS